MGHSKRRRSSSSSPERRRSDEYRHKGRHKSKCKRRHDSRKRKRKRQKRSVSSSDLSSRSSSPSRLRSSSVSESDLEVLSNSSKRRPQQIERALSHSKQDVDVASSNNSRSLPVREVTNAIRDEMARGSSNSKPFPEWCPPLNRKNSDTHNMTKSESSSRDSEKLLPCDGLLEPRPSTSREKCDDREGREDDSETDSEEELMFSWENYRHELNQLFFRDEDVIKRGTEEYHDFWKFLKKYHGLQKQKKIRDMCSKDQGGGRKGYIGKDDDNSHLFSPLYQLPLTYDKRYSINFALNLKDAKELQRRRLPPQDLEDGKRRLSLKKILEAKYIILLYLDFIQKQRFEKYRKLREAQASLPIAAYKKEIISTVKENNVVIIAGDTGCGKSTQVPQYLLAAGFSNIACTQPRRIACISLSKRVAYETLNEFGSKVGFQIRFEKHKTEHTKIVFLTEGLLLRQVSADSSLSLYDVIILDEIHERHLHTDFLLGVMKCLLQQRDNVKIILMSATINIDLFRSYFMGTAPVIQVPGRLYPIQLQYFPVPMIEQASKKEKINPAPYVRIMQLIDSKYPDNERGDVLIFLSGMSEISTVVEAAKVYAQQTNRWIVLPLHSTLSVSEQEKVFDIPPEGIRKCIVSTNIAETSVTIDGVRFVVDSGKVKEMSFDSQSKMQKLKEFWISQASAEQRKGRAGRTGPGSCFRLYSEQEYDSFLQYSTPEIQRVPLDSLVLQMISMGLPNIRLFPFIEPPAPESLENSVNALKAQAALTDQEGLTTIGKLLSQLPMDVSLGKMLIMGSLFHQVDPVLSLAAAMSVQSPFTNRAHRDPECLAAVKNLESDHGDPFTLLASYREWLNIKLEGYEHSRKWCRRRGLEEQRFYEMTKLRSQFAQLLQDSGLQDVAGKTRSALTSAERARRNGELRQLHELKRELRKEGPRKTKVLKVAQGEGMASDEEDPRTDIKDLDFRIKNDKKQLGEIYRSSDVHSFKDVVMLKIILCSGLYPNVAIADEHNNYKSGSEQLFHTKSKPFTILHPNSVFASHPEVLQVAESDIAELPGFNIRNPASTKHQLLAYVSLLETNKAYLVDMLRAPTAQVLFLFAHSIDTNADMTVIACDNFIELRFPDAVTAQNLVFQAVQLRTKWKRLLEVRIKASVPTVENQDKLIAEANALERDLSIGLIDFYLSETLYSQRRLLDADVKLLHYGPGPGDCVLSGNPFSDGALEPCRPNDVKGGVSLTEFLTYNCLLDTECAVTTITSYDTVCLYCDEEFHFTTLERLAHMNQCLKNCANVVLSDSDEEKGYDGSSIKKKYECETCNRTFWLTIKDIFKHKKQHTQPEISPLMDL